MIRATNPTNPAEGVVYADNYPAHVLKRVKENGWAITTLEHPPTLDLPNNTEPLWPGVLATGLPWRLHLRTEPVEGHKITELHIQGLDPDRDPDRWSEWVWVGNAMPRNNPPRIPLHKARKLLAARAR